MHLQSPFNWEKANIAVVVHAPDIFLLTCEIVSVFPLQIHEEPDIVPHVMELLYMRLKVYVHSVKLFSVNIANETAILGIITYFLRLGSKCRESVNNDTTDDRSDNQVHNHHISEIVASRRIRRYS